MARCSPTQPSCLLVKSGPFEGGEGEQQRVMGILWESWFVVMGLGGRGLARRGKCMLVATCGGCGD